MMDSINEKDRISVAENDFYTIQIMKLRKEFYLWEMAALLLNVNPLYVKLIESNGHKFRVMVADYTVKDSPRHSKHYLYQELKKAMIDAVDYGELELFGDELISFNYCQQDNLRDTGDTGSCASEYHKLSRHTVQAWVEKYNFETTFFETQKVAVNLPNYLDKNHPEHSLTLGIAIEAWERFSDLGISHPKKYVEKWLSEQHSNLSQEVRDEIAKMANWNKSGGAPSKGFKTDVYQQALDKEITTFSTQPKP
jgi:hypothetical protein